MRWLGEQKSLTEQYAKELAAFRAEAEAVLAGPAGELPDDVFASAAPWTGSEMFSRFVNREHSPSEGPVVLNLYVESPEAGGIRLGDHNEVNTVARNETRSLLRSADTMSISDVGVPGYDTCHSTLPAGKVTSAAGRRLQQRPEHRVSLEDRRRAAWVATFETGRALGL